MINTELRVGNWVTCSEKALFGDGKNRTEVTVRSLTAYESPIVVFNQKEDHGLYHIEESIKGIEPIELTTEWLEKFGYKKTNGYGYKIFGNWLQEEKDDTTWYYNVNGNLVDVPYVHTFQNLIHALTGKELKINESKE